MKVEGSCGGGAESHITWPYWGATSKSTSVRRASVGMVDCPCSGPRKVKFSFATSWRSNGGWPSSMRSDCKLPYACQRDERNRHCRTAGAVAGRRRFPQSRRPSGAPHWPICCVDSRQTQRATSSRQVDSTLTRARARVSPPPPKSHKSRTSAMPAATSIHRKTSHSEQEYRTGARVCAHDTQARYARSLLLIALPRGVAPKARARNRERSLVGQAPPDITRCAPSHTIRCSNCPTLPVPSGTA